MFKKLIRSWCLVALALLMCLFSAPSVRADNGATQGCKKWLQKAPKTS